MAPLELASTIAASLVVGALIGAIGVGGVLLVPWLVHAAGVPVQQAAAIAMLAFVGPGAVALVVARRAVLAGGRVDWALVAATIPGALLGAAALAVVPERAALAVLAASVAIVGLRLVAGPSAGAAPGPAASGASPAVGGVAVGAFTGFASALTATGGPMVLTPLALWRGVPLPEAVALGQLVQLPIAATATAGHALAGTADVAAGATIGALLVPGVLLGHRLGPRVPRRALGRTLGAVLLAAAAAFAARALR